MKHCRKGVMWKDSVANFSMHSLTKCNLLSHNIQDGSYKLSPYVQFKIYEPKERDILATRIRDRVFQRSMCDNGLYYDMTNDFIYDNGACLVGKGMDFAIGRFKTFLYRFYREHGNSGYAIHLDVKKYFPSTPHEIAKALVAEKVTNKDYVKYVHEIIDSFPDNRTEEEIANDPFGLRGIGLGSQTSQLIQLALLNKLDHDIKEKFHIKYYIRYMDDMIIVHHDKNKIREVRDYIFNELATLGLTGVDKGGIFPLKQGIYFLKLRFMLTETGKVVIRMSKKGIARERKQLDKLKAMLDNGSVSMNDVEMHYQSWIAHAKRANSHGVIKEMDRYYSNLFRKKPVYSYTRHNKKKKNKTEVAKNDISES